MTQKTQNRETENTEPQSDAHELMLDILDKLGCEPIENDDCTLNVEYLGIKFFMEFSGVYVRIWDLMWYGVEEQDPALSAVQFAANDANFNFGPTVVLAKLHEGNLVGVHSRRDIMVHPSFPDKVAYIGAVFESFRRTRERFEESLQEKMSKLMEAQNNRRPVGFTTGSTSNE